jgi:hypothetical protein
VAEKIRPLWEWGESKRQMALAAGFSQYGGSAANKIDAALVRLEQRYGSATTPDSGVAAFAA